MCSVKGEQTCRANKLRIISDMQSDLYKLKPLALPRRAYGCVKDLCIMVVGLTCSTRCSRKMATFCCGVTGCTSFPWVSFRILRSVAHGPDCSNSV